MKRLTSFFADQSGVSIVEFSLLLPIFAVLLAATVDFGLAFASKLQLSAAVDEGAQYAFLTGAGVTTGSIQTVVKNATGLTPITVAATYSPNACFCVTGPPAALSAQACGVPCADNSAPGLYAQITASYTYAPVFPGFALLTNPVMSEQATVRVQ